MQVVFRALKKFAQNLSKTEHTTMQKVLLQESNFKLEQTVTISIITLLQIIFIITQMYGQ